MCVIAYGRACDFVENDLRLCDQRNGAGIGFAWKDNKLRFMRGLSLTELFFMLSQIKSSDPNIKVCVHFRRTTRDVKQYLTHPFVLVSSTTIMSGQDYPLFFHNGTITDEELNHLAKVVKYSETQLERDFESYKYGLTSNTEMFSKIMSNKSFETVDFAISSILVSGNRSRIAVWYPDMDDPVFYNKHKFFKRRDMIYSNYRSVRYDVA